MTNRIWIMAKFLDPKAGLTFKKVFNNHPDLLTSLFNALLPLTPLHKDTIVDVRCRDVQATGLSEKEIRALAAISMQA